MNTEKNPMVLISDAINANDLDALKALFDVFPEYIMEFTPFAGATWLHYAAKKGKNSIVEYLISLGINIDTGDRWDGTSALDFAALENQIETAKLLIEKGIKFDLSTSVRNPLFAAIVGRSPEIVQLLLKAGIDATVRYNSDTMQDMDAVAFALMRGEYECAELIARWNANGDEVLAKQALIEADKIAERNAFARQ